MNRISELVLPMFVVCIVMLVFHIPITKSGDDIIFSNVHNLLPWMKKRYLTWSSRSIIDFVVVLLARAPIVLWKVLNIAMIVISGISMSKLVQIKNKKVTGWCIAFSILFFSIVELASAGWIATTINYLWPLSMGLFYLISIKKTLYGEKIGKFEYIGYMIALFFSSNQEQMACVLFGILLCVMVYQFLKKEHSLWIILSILVVLFVLIFILTCPGNASRTISEVTKWFPKYTSYNVLEKGLLGFGTTMNYLVLTSFMHPLCFLFHCVCMYTVWWKTKNGLLRLIGCVPALISVGCVGLRVIGVPTEVYMCPEQFDASIWYKQVVVLLCYILLFVCIGISIVVIWGLNKNMLCNLMIFLIGFSSKWMMGFSPTVYASSDRTALFLNAALIYVMLNAIGQLIEKQTKTDKVLILMLLFCLCGVICVNITVAYDMPIVNWIVNMLR